MLTCVTNKMMVHSGRAFEQYTFMCSSLWSDIQQGNLLAELTSKHWEAHAPRVPPLPMPRTILIYTKHVTLCKYI